MTFKSLLTILACSLICPEAVSRAFAAGPAASHTTITNTIDIMGAVESAQENNAGGYGGQNIYSTNGESANMILSTSKISDDDHQLASTDISNYSKTRFSDTRKIPAVSQTPADVSGNSGPSYSSYIAASSGPSISVFSTGPNARTISYSAPGGVFISHGYPGSSYVLSAHRQPLKTYSSSSYPRENYADINYVNSGVNSVPKKSTIPEISSSSYPYPSHSSTTIFGIPGREYLLHNLDPNSKILISGGVDSSSIINFLGGIRPATTTSSVHGYIGHPAYAVARRNLEAAREIVDGIYSAVSRAVNINLARVGAAR